MKLNSRKRVILLGLAVVCLCAIGAAGRYIVRGGMSARQTPSALESIVAQALVQWSIPSASKAQGNPLGARNNAADIAAGHELYAGKCQSCHGYDGSGKTDAGGGLFPPPISLRPSALEKRKRTDGELFYLIRNGVRNTGMPGWPLTDQQTWQLVSFLRNLPGTVSLAADAKVAPGSVSPGQRRFVGSSTCTRAGARRRWPTSCATHASTRTRSFPISTSPIRW
jgi:mono/diheme cytochrome c family protein